MLLAEGLTNREIGAQISLSPKTVEYHLTHIYRLQIDPTAAIAPSADLVAWSRLGSAYQPAQLQQALEQDRTAVSSTTRWCGR